jgi:glycosyltransferase involved in cell wall biosynthesis
MPRALILVENNSAPADTRVWAICLSLQRAGWNVAVICPTGKHRDTERFAVVDGVKIYRFEAHVSSGSALGYLREYALAFVRMWSLVRRLSRSDRFDVIHACNPPDFLLLVALGRRRRGTATVFDHHDLSPELYRAKYRARSSVERVLRLAERIGFGLADVTLASNESFRRVALDRGRKSAENVFIVRNGPDTQVFHPRRGDSTLRSGAEYLIGYVGLMSDQDGADVAVEALSRLRTRRDDWRAIFVGDGDALPAVRELTRARGLDDRVTFSGYVQDPARLVEIIASCDICLSPEPRNGLNERSTFIKVAEYMAVGRPLVAFDLPETRRTAGDSASYAAGDDPEAFAEAIDGLLSDETRRAQMGALGVQRVREELGWERSEQALLAAYNRAVMLAATRLSGTGPRTSGPDRDDNSDRWMVDRSHRHH